MICSYSTLMGNWLNNSFLLNNYSCTIGIQFMINKSNMGIYIAYRYYCVMRGNICQGIINSIGIHDSTANQNMIGIIQHFYGKSDTVTRMPHIISGFYHHSTLKGTHQNSGCHSRTPSHKINKQSGQYRSCMGKYMASIHLFLWMGSTYPNKWMSMYSYIGTDHSNRINSWFQIYSSSMVKHMAHNTSDFPLGRLDNTAKDMIRDSSDYLRSDRIQYSYPHSYRMIHIAVSCTSSSIIN